MKKSLILLGLLYLESCTVVKEYEKVQLNDPNMELNSRSSERFETTAQTYREGASGGNGGKTGGGCGCN